MSDLPQLEEVQISDADFKRRSRRSILFAALSGGFGVALFEWINKMDWDRGIPWLLRRAFELSDAGFKATFRKDALAPKVGPAATPIRINGDIGMLSSVDLSNYRLNLQSPTGNRILTIEDVRRLPQKETAFLFKCIEGWSQNVECRGAHFSDLINETGIGKYSSAGQDLHYKYALLKSLNGEYYVSMDVESLLHPQTLLVYEMSGAPLEVDNGFPLRLMTAVKYGVKSIKQVGSIEFSDHLPPDYWADNGYGDFVGL